jgi:hypothetical protein
MNKNLAQKLAKVAADHINYVGLDAPSESGWMRIDNVIDLLTEKEKESLKVKEIGDMKYKDVMKIEDKLNSLLESGKYDK